MLHITSAFLKPWEVFRKWRQRDDHANLGSQPVQRDSGDHLVLFVHGLSGSALGTWEPMLRAFESDPELNGVAFGCYTYPTSLLRLPFGTRMAGVREIANGLRTHIETHYGDKEHLTLVGHSLGGIITRQYILEELKCQRISKIRGVVLFATPHTGSALANIGKTLSKSHRHLDQLCKGADILEIINSDWVKLKVEDMIEALYIVGGCDVVVSKESAAPYLGADNVRTLIDHGHTEVIKPADKADTRFKILKAFVLKVMPIERELPKNSCAVIQNTGDVLFDSYSRPSECFYIKRTADNALSNATRSAHAWVSGPPGVGKTASLKRLIETSDWQLHHVILDGYRGLGALDLMREVCNFLCEKVNIESNGIPRSSDYATVISYFRRALAELRSTKPVAILIEEIPLPSGTEYTTFLDIAYNLTLLTEEIGNLSRVVWLFSSIRNPRPDIRPGEPKILERVQFLEFEPWADDDMGNLVDLVCTELGIALLPAERIAILKRAKGSPRFIKMLFRRKRNEIAAGKQLQELLTSVELDLA